jgi:hypothetical protein
LYYKLIANFLLAQELLLYYSTSNEKSIVAFLKTYYGGTGKRSCPSIFDPSDGAKVPLVYKVFIKNKEKKRIHMCATEVSLKAISSA